MIQEPNGLSVGYFEHYSRIGRCYLSPSFEYLQGDIILGVILNGLDLAGIGCKIDDGYLGILAVPRRRTRTTPYDDGLPVSLYWCKSR